MWSISQVFFFKNGDIMLAEEVRDDVRNKKEFYKAVGREYEHLNNKLTFLMKKHGIVLGKATPIGEIKPLIENFPIEIAMPVITPMMANEPIKKKTDHIRDFLNDHPNAKPKEVVNYLI